MHKVSEMSALSDAGSADRLESLVLVRIASTARSANRGEIAGDLAPFAGPQMPASRWREAVERAIASLGTAGMVSAKPGGLVATAAGAVAAARFLGLPASTPLAWDQACNVWLIGRALGQRRTPAKRLAALATHEGLRAAILVQAYGLQIKGAATPARLRQALAAAALRKAFGGETASALAGKTGLPARASRLLAAQLLEKPRDPGTDRRLISALAAQASGARSADPSALRTAVLRRYFAIPEPPAPERAVSKPPLPAPAPAAGPRVEPQLPSSPNGGAPAGRPLDLPGFALEVRQLAAREAQGWSGDRKAYISRVWRTIRERRPEWGLSEIEFKCMLAEAHRSGQLALANADLKDESNIKDVQDSAVTYRNTVFHFIRVDA